MKHNLFLRVGLLLLVATLAMSSIFVASGTAARYVASGTTSAQAMVASFNVTVSGDKLTADNAAAVTAGNFGSQLKEQDAMTNETTDHVSVVAPVSLIAPGTGGKIEISIANLSQVGVLITLEPGSGGNDLGGKLQFCADAAKTGATFGALSAVLKDVVENHPKYIDDPDIGTGIFLAPSETLTGAGALPFYWRWLFSSGDDAGDTALGIAPVQASIPIKVTATQAN